MDNAPVHGVVEKRYEYRNRIGRGYPIYFAPYANWESE